ncbi:Myb/SANT-like DNA-binding domain 4 [Dillenia turbinata]|uniref:Myb/SANT-like DNA-binding domain 4 n=1 Tax=Dillenia turbinata TaxID=194707 RepID=A0AAN8V1C5_9MAGN
MNDDDATTATASGSPPPPSALPPPPPSRPSHSLPVREDCWSEEATFTLVEAWGERYLLLNRGNLRQKHWQEVADAVNARHGHIKKARRTDVQCKNRIDTLKKKYKIEKARVSESNGSYTSQWPFFPQLDALIGSSVKKSSAFPASVPTTATGIQLSYRKSSPVLPLSSPIPVAPRSKRPTTATTPSPMPLDDSNFRRNFSVFAAAAAAAVDSDSSRSTSSSSSRRRNRDRSKKRNGDSVRDDDGNGFRELARTIARFGEIYERVEGAKQRQMIELEKQRMQFAKDLEFQKMQLFMDTQVQLEKMKRAKRSSESGEHLKLFEEVRD